MLNAYSQLLLRVRSCLFVHFESIIGNARTVGSPEPIAVNEF